MRGRSLFHYTARHHAAEIRAAGAISRGAVPIPTADGMELEALAPGFQWLTESDDWAQPWATRSRSACDRTECRLVVAIPATALRRLYRWADVYARFGYTTESATRLARINGGSVDAARSWHVFAGAIPYRWVVRVDERPVAVGGG